MLMTETGKSLCPFVLRGLFVTRGRLGTRAMTKALGYSQLIILAPTSRLAELVMMQAHNSDHRQSKQDALHHNDYP